jgi:flagellar basal-body rod protein FlgB
MRIFDATLARLERSLDVRLIRHNVLAGNLANVDTVGYQPKDVDFTTAMSGESGTEVRVVDGEGAAPSLDGNRVDLDRTMAQLAENGMQYGAGARAASKKLAILRYVVSDGNG